MERKNFFAKAWNNGQPKQTGSGYGLRMSTYDRNWFFIPNWNTVTLNLASTGQSSVVEVKVTPSFWKNCPELRNKEIGLWFLENRWVPWPHGSPPRFQFTATGVGEFEVKRFD